MTHFQMFEVYFTTNCVSLLLRKYFLFYKKAKHEDKNFNFNARKL